MKKFLTVVLLVLVSISLTGCLKKTTEEKTEEELFSGSFMDLLGKGKNIKCTFNDDNENGRSDGTIYVSGKKSRNDIYVEVEGEEKIEYHTIIDSEYMYTWSSLEEQGTKMKFSELEDSTEDFDTPSASEMKDAYGEFRDVQKETNFKCMPWIPNNSKFNPPSDIEFVDMTEMMEGMQQQAEDMQESLKDMCGMCDMMPTEEEKVDCRIQMGCE